MCYSAIAIAWIGVRGDMGTQSVWSSKAQYTLPSQYCSCINFINCSNNFFYFHNELYWRGLKRLQNKSKAIDLMYRISTRKDVICKKYRGSKLVDVGSKLWGQSKIHDLRLVSLLALQHPI